MAADDATPFKSQSDDERFLSLIVIAKPKDRFRAMDIRRDDGVTIEYLGECVVTDEKYCGVGVAQHIELLKGWLETITDRLGKVEGDCTPSEEPEGPMH